MKKILISMGDPAGIGPEVVVKCLARMAALGAKSDHEPVVVGEREILEETAHALGIKFAARRCW